MHFTPLLFFVAQLLVAVLAVPAPLLDNAIEGRSLEARTPVIQFHLCTGINYGGTCYYLSTEPLSTIFSSHGCVNLKPGVASSVKSIRVFETWRYAVELHDGVSCSGAGVSILDSDDDLGAWANRAKSARVFAFPVTRDLPNSAV